MEGDCIGNVSGHGPPQISRMKDLCRGLRILKNLFVEVFNHSISFLGNYFLSRLLDPLRVPTTDRIGLGADQSLGSMKGSRGQCSFNGNSLFGDQNRLLHRSAQCGVT